MRKLLRLAVLAVVVALAVGTQSAYAAPTNPWLDLRVLNMAHQGGENEAPSNTMYAFKRAVALGANVLEFDVHATSDGELVVIHDATVDRTTEGTGRVRDKTRAQVQALDAAYEFVPGRGTVAGLPPGDYPFRGVRTGAVPPPAGYTAEDFRIPTLRDVLAAFPTVPLNIEIKGTTDADLASFLRHATMLAGVLKRTGRTDFVVVSFNDLAVARFHRLAPNIPVAPGIARTLAYVTTGAPPGPGVAALQLPVELNGIPIVTPALVRRAHADGFAVHAWMSGQPENDALYHRLIDMCVDGIMPAFPSRLEAVLDARNIVRPGQPGEDPC
jgi:glycerophosphoryl diester phosphodiesterase